MNIIYLIFCLFVKIQIIVCYDTRFYNTDLPVFEPFPLSIINPSASLCKNASTNVMAVFKSKQMNYLALNLQLCGFAIYDITHPEKEVLIKKYFEYDPAKGSVISLSITDYSNFLWVGYINGLIEIYDIQQNNFPLIYSQKLGQNDILNKVLQFQEYNLTFLACYKNFKLVRWENNQPSILKEVELNDWNIAKIRFAFSKAILVVQGFTSVHFYKQPISNLQQGNLNYICSFKPSSAYILTSFEVLQETVLVIQLNLFQFTMIDVSDFINSFDGQTCNISQIKYLDKYPSTAIGSQFALSKDQKFLYTQQSSKGILVFDVSQLKFEIFQIIRTEGTVGDIQLTGDESYLYHTNWFEAKIFRRTYPNLNLDVPNLLLNEYQLISYTFYKTPQGNFDLQVAFEQPSNVLFMTRKDKGSAVFQYYGQSVMDLVSLTNYDVPNISISYQARVPGTNIFYQSREILGLQIVDYSDLSQPKILKTNLSLGFKTYKFEFIIFNKEGTLCFIANIIGIAIVSVRDVSNPQVISFLDTSKYLKGDQSLYKFSISNDEKTLFLFHSAYGIVCADISDPFNPSFLFQIYLGTIYFAQQTKDSQFLICGAGYQGVFIYKINEDRSLTFLSQTKIQGAIYFLRLIYNDNYLIVTTGEIEQIILVSLVDKYNPEIIQIIHLQENSPLYWSAVSKDESFLFSTSQRALYQFFIQSQIIIHSSFYKLEPIPNSNQYKRQLLPKGQSFQVGDQIQIYLVNIYQTKKLKIQEAFYYHNFVTGNLPSWMQFSPSDQVLNIQVSKESLIANQNGQFISKTLQQVIFMSYQGIDDYAFTNPNLNISQDDSKKIKEACTRAGYLDKTGFVASSYSPKNEFNLLDDQSQQILQKWSQNDQQQQQLLDFIQYILNQNVINYVIQFHTEPSLFVDFKNSTNPISSNQNSITVTLSVSNGLFVNKLYNGVLVLINSEQNVIQLQGSVQGINSVLLSTIKLSLQDQAKINQATTDITVDDQINYQFIQSLSLREAKFISLQSPVVTASSLQQDFNQYYSKGELTVETPFNYKISNTVFKSVDSDQLQYTAKLINKDGIYEEIPTGYWLSFSSNERTLIGTPQTSLYNQQFVIQIEATDGYTIAKDQLIIKISIIPFFIILQMIIQIVGPLLGILGIWKYRMIFYNITFRHFLIYSKEVVHVSEYYEKKIIITDNLLEIALKLWQPAQKQLQQKLIQQEIIQIYQVNKINELINTKYSCNFFKKIEQNLTFSEQLKKSIHFNNQFNHDSIDQSNIICSNQQDSKLEDNRKELSMKDSVIEKRQKKNFEINQQSISVSRNQYQQENVTSSLIRQITFNDRIRAHTTKKQTSNQQLLLSNGQVNFDSIKNLVLQKYENNSSEKKVISKAILKQLNNKHSRISTILQYLAAEYFVSCSGVCTQIVNLLKQKALTTYKEIDWYKAYVSAQVNEKVLDTNFPTYNLNEDFIKLALYEIAEDMLKQQNKLSKKEQDQQQSEYDNSFLKEVIVYLPLIEQYLYSVALGISSKKRKFFEVAKGDCFHCYSFKVRSIKCYEKTVIFHCCVGAQEFLGINQVEKGLSENQRLPEWLQIDFKKTEITLKGTPEQKDIGQSRFKIYDVDGYLIRQFDIQVLPSRKSQNPTNQETQSKQDNLFQAIVETPKRMLLSNKFNINTEKINTNVLSLNNSQIIEIPSDQILEFDENSPSSKNTQIIQNSAKNLNEKNFRLLKHSSNQQ